MEKLNERYNKYSNRLNILLFTIFVVSSLAFVSVLAEGSDAASSGTCGDNLVWDLDDNGNLTRDK